MKKAYMIIDLQYGSTGKGLLAGYLAEQEKPDVVVTAWGPNAGHTYIDKAGRTYIHRMLANGIVSPNLKAVLIGPGSVIDLAILRSEIESCADLLQGKIIIIHPKAVIVTAEHVAIESRNVKIGSTMKGTGAAVIQRIERNPDDTIIARDAIGGFWLKEMDDLGVYCFVSEQMYAVELDKAKVIQIEGAQGFSLSIYHGHYPYTTSRDVTPAQVMADCAIPFSIIPEVYGTLRTFPIRVANRFDVEGKQIGTSGPCYDDQRELEWSDLGIPAELTTVTKLPRRVFTFSMKQTKDAVRLCGPSKLFLNFANYLGISETRKLADRIADETGVEVTWIGFGPTVEDVEIFLPWHKTEENGNV